MSKIYTWILISSIRISYAFTSISNNFNNVHKALFSIIIQSVTKGPVSPEPWLSYTFVIFNIIVPHHWLTGYLLKHPPRGLLWQFPHLVPLAACAVPTGAPCNSAPTGGSGLGAWLACLFACHVQRLLAAVAGVDIGIYGAVLTHTYRQYRKIGCTLHTYYTNLAITQNNELFV